MKDAYDKVYKSIKCKNKKLNKNNFLFSSHFLQEIIDWYIYF